MERCTNTPKQSFCTGERGASMRSKSAKSRKRRVSTQWRHRRCMCSFNHFCQLSENHKKHGTTDSLAAASRTALSRTRALKTACKIAPESFKDVIQIYEKAMRNLSQNLFHIDSNNFKNIQFEVQKFDHFEVQNRPFWGPKPTILESKSRLFEGPKGVQDRIPLGT